MTEIDYITLPEVRAQTLGTQQVEATTGGDFRGIILYGHPQNKEATLIKEWPFCLLLLLADPGNYACELTYQVAG